MNASSSLNVYREIRQAHIEQTQQAINEALAVHRDDPGLPYFPIAANDLILLQLYGFDWNFMTGKVERK